MKTLLLVLLSTLFVQSSFAGFRESGGGAGTELYIIDRFEKFQVFFNETQDSRITRILSNSGVRKSHTNWLKLTSAAMHLVQPGNLEIVLSLRDDIYTTERSGYTFRAERLNHQKKRLHVNLHQYVTDFHMLGEKMFDLNLMHEFLRFCNVDDDDYYYSRQLHPIFLETNLPK